MFEVYLSLNLHWRVIVPLVTFTTDCICIVQQFLTTVSTELQHLCDNGKAFIEAVCSMLYQGKEQ